MDRDKVLADLINSAAGAKAHFEIWWAQVGEAKPTFVKVMNAHSDFFNASADAHFTAFVVYLSHLYDKRKDSSSIGAYFACQVATADAASFDALRLEYQALSLRAAPLVTARHKAVAHIDARKSEKDVFESLNLTPNEVRSIIYESASFIAKLAGESDPRRIGICRDGRLVDATLRLIGSLQEENA